MNALSRHFAQPVHITLANGVLFAGLSAIAFSYVVLLTLDPLVAQSLAQEDALIEDLGAVFCFIAAFLFLITYLESSGPNRFVGVETKRNVWLLLLALLMIMVVGEELSWGQRIFGWSTPSDFKALNAQHETNIHNLWIFQAEEPGGEPKAGLALLLNPNRMLSMFWLAYCVLIPLLVMFSASARRLTHFFGFPIPRFATGTLFIVNFAMFRFIATYGTMDHDTLAAFDELKETNYEFAFLVLAFCFMMRLALSKSQKVSA